MPRILIVSYHYPPSVAIGARRPARLARLLPGHGYEVEVLAGSPDQSPRRPWRHVEWTRGDESGESPPCPVLRVPTPYVFRRNPNRPPEEGFSIRRLWWKARAYAEFLVSTYDWQWRWGVNALECLERTRDLTRYDLVLASVPSAFAVIPVVRRFRELGIPIVMDWRDLWTLPEPHSALPGSLHPDQRRLRWDDRHIREAKALGDHLVFTTTDARDAAEQFYGLDRDRLSVIPNAFERTHEPSPPSDPMGRGMEIVYAGSVSYGRDRQIETLISAMSRLEREGGPQVRLRIVGGESDRIEQAIRDHGMSASVQRHGWMSRDEAVRVQLEADALLLLQPLEHLHTRVAIPAKLFEYMACRRNILSIASRVSNDIVRRHDLGVTASGHDVDDMVQALVELARRVERRPVLPPPPQEFSQERTTAEYARILERTLSRRAQPASPPPVGS